MAREQAIRLLDLRDVETLVPENAGVYCHVDDLLAYLDKVATILVDEGDIKVLPASQVVASISARLTVELSIAE